MAQWPRVARLMPEHLTTKARLVYWAALCTLAPLLLSVVLVPIGGHVTHVAEVYEDVSVWKMAGTAVAAALVLGCVLAVVAALRVLLTRGTSARARVGGLLTAHRGGEEEREEQRDRKREVGKEEEK